MLIRVGRKTARAFQGMDKRCSSHDFLSLSFIHRDLWRKGNFFISDHIRVWLKATLNENRVYVIIHIQFINM